MYCTFGSMFFNKYHCNYSISQGNGGSFVYVIRMKDWFCESVEWYISTFWVEQFWHRHGLCISIQTSWLWQEVVQLLKQCRLLLVIYFILGMYVLWVHAPYVCHRTVQRVVVTAWWLLVSPSEAHQPSNKVELGMSISVSKHFFLRPSFLSYIVKYSVLLFPLSYTCNSM